MKSVKAEAEKWGTRARGHEVGERAIYISIPKVSVVWGSAAFIRGPCAFTAAGNAYRLPHTACFVTANVRATVLDILTGRDKRMPDQIGLKTPGRDGERQMYLYLDPLPRCSGELRHCHHLTAYCILFDRLIHQMYLKD